MCTFQCIRNFLLFRSFLVLTPFWLLFSYSYSPLCIYIGMLLCCIIQRSILDSFKEFTSKVSIRAIICDRYHHICHFFVLLCPYVYDLFICTNFSTPLFKSVEVNIIITSLNLIHIYYH